MSLTSTAENPITRMAGDERRQQILKEAMRLFSEDGFRGTTTKKIAEAAGISEAMVFRHFANKDDLYSAILDYKACSHKLEDPLRSVREHIANKDDFNVFYGFALNALEHHKDDPEFMRLLLFSALEGHDLAKMFFGSFVTGMYETLSAYIRSRQADGAFKNIEPKTVVRAFVGMLIHHSLTNLLFDPEQKLLRISEEEAARSFATILLEGISN
jgi:AcrR family transcriptional regulator